MTDIESSGELGRSGRHPATTGRSRFTPLTVVGASALALLVVGAGAAVGMAGRPPDRHLGISGGDRAGHDAGRPGSGLLAPTRRDRPGRGSDLHDDGAPSGEVAGASEAPPAQAPPTTVAPVPVPVVTSTTSSPRSPRSGSPTTTAGPIQGGPGTPSLPAAGSYAYQTQGSSTIAIFGSTNYPSTTTIVVSDSGCGVSSVWNSGPGDSQTVQECPVAGGLRVVSDASTVTAGTYTTTQSFQCPPNAFIPLGSGTPGQTWSWACSSSNGETSSQTVKLIGPATVTVGGMPVSAEEVSVDSTLSGPESGTVSTTYWFGPDATPLKEIGNIRAAQDGFSYNADYTLQLSSLQPAS